MTNHFKLNKITTCLLLAILCTAVASKENNQRIDGQAGIDSSSIHDGLNDRPANKSVIERQTSRIPAITQKSNNLKKTSWPKPIQISGWGWMTFGKIEKSYYERTRHGRYNYENKWMNNYEIGLIFRKEMTENAWAKIHINGCLCYPILEEEATDAKSQKKTFVTRLLEASQYFKFVDRKNLFADLRFGYWSHKYNPQSRNLGEYLFRSGTYPQYLKSGFEIADKVKVAGLQLGISLHESFRQEIFLRTEMEFFPLYDFSLAYLVHYQPNLFFNLSAGIDLFRLIPANKKMTVPAEDTLVFKRTPFDMIRTHYMDGADTVKATFAGQRAMVRFTIDPKWFLSAKNFGKEDLKFYAEAALLGFKNYPNWHEEILHRIPIMGGFNFPTFKIFDVLALEVEYFASPYSNSTHSIYENRSPIPYIGPPEPRGPEYDTYNNKRRDNWKWSLYANRKIGQFFRISGQVANDHSTRFQGNGSDITQTPSDWYWMTRVMFYFQ